jgi:hypothetical protein
MPRAPDEGPDVELEMDEELRDASLSPHLDRDDDFWRYASVASGNAEAGASAQRMGVEPAASSTPPAALATCVPADDRMQTWHGQGWHLLLGEGVEGLGSPTPPQLHDGSDMGVGIGEGVSGGCSAGAGDDEETNRASVDNQQSAMGDEVCKRARTRTRTHIRVCTHTHARCTYTYTRTTERARVRVCARTHTRTHTTSCRLPSSHAWTETT